MAMTVITCPTCGADGSLSLIDPEYRGPYVCWKCHNLFNIHIQGGQLSSCTPMSEDEARKLRESRPKTFGRPSE